MMGGLPVGDWQFVVVTVVALAAAWRVVRVVREIGRGGACEDCSCPAVGRSDSEGGGREDDLVQIHSLSKR